MKKTLLLFLLLGLLSPITSFAQYITIRPLAIQYSSPGVNNNLEVIADVILPTSLPKRIGYSSSISNDTLYLTACYFSGPLHATSQIKDTLQVGSMPSGIHGLHFRAYCSGNQNACDSTTFEEKMVAFNIQKPTGITENTQTLKPEIFPNPAIDFVWIESGPLKQITFRDLSGRIIGSEVYKGETAVKLDVSSFPKGVYFLETLTENGQISRKRLLKN